MVPASSSVPNTVSLTVDRTNIGRHVVTELAVSARSAVSPERQAPGFS